MLNLDLLHYIMINIAVLNKKKNQNKDHYLSLRLLHLFHQIRAISYLIWFLGSIWQTEHILINWAKIQILKCNNILLFGLKPKVDIFTWSVQF